MKTKKCRITGDPHTLGAKGTKWLRKVVGSDWSFSVTAQASNPQVETYPSIEVELTTATGESCILVIDKTTLQAVKKESVREASRPPDSTERLCASEPAPQPAPKPVPKPTPKPTQYKPPVDTVRSHPSSDEADYDVDDVISVADPTIVPITCNRSELRGYLNPFSSAQDKSYILYEGKATTEERFFRLVHEEMRSKGIKGKRPTVARVSGVTGSGMSVKEWLKRAGALYGENVVGQRLACYWGELDDFYVGIVRAFVEDTGAHHVVYDDGDEVYLHLTLQKVHWLRPHGDPFAPPPPEPCRPLRTPPELPG
eukprot:CAMPEP_0118953144 /NCGR_PEP_ID=MMETSP1169-20130426/56040_1 /TAXON_ID=36882 /ORGANISM="Pyramimonas obovata, Strain CCMP722" /LENGTH=311 /DNA_ID=CAMNT_0006900531 /DNA_START=208 /DNA_END=1139 /DNA_ORIENTATION=+